MRSIACFLILLFHTCCIAQAIFEQQDEIDRINSTEFGIPASPVFDLMGVTPSQVVRTTDIKDFKVDWSFKSWSLSPNLSFQTQPFWEIFYNRKPISKYQRANKFQRLLTTLDVSAGSVLNEEANRRIGAAVKMGVYRERDLMMEKDIFSDIDVDISARKNELDSLLIVAQNKLKKNTNVLEKPALMMDVQSLELEIFGLHKERQAEIQERLTILINEYWNASYLDVGVGKINTFFSDAFGNLDSLRLDRNTAFGLWVNGGLRAGKYSLISGLIRGHKYREQVTFTLQNDVTEELFDTTSVAGNVLMTYGINYRYGSPIFSFFTEFIVERKATKTPVEALTKSFDTPSDFSIINESVNWNIVHPITINIGGDWRMKRNLILNFGMRTVFDKSFALKTFLPVVGISCLMR